MTTIAIVYHSDTGHTKLQAQAVRKGAETVEGTRILFLTTEEAASSLVDLDRADAIIFGCPTYMGSMSGKMKLFLEAAVDRWSTRAWQDKIAGAFTNSLNFSGDKVNTLVGLMINAMQQGMIYVSLGVNPATNGHSDSLKTLEGPGADAINRVDGSIGPMAASFMVPAGDAPPSGDIETAEFYGRRVAAITAQFVRGRQG